MIFINEEETIGFTETLTDFFMKYNIVIEDEIETETEVNGHIKCQTGYNYIWIDRYLWKRAHSFFSEKDIVRGFFLKGKKSILLTNSIQNIEEKYDYHIGNKFVMVGGLDLYDL